MQSLQKFLILSFSLLLMLATACNVSRTAKGGAIGGAAGGVIGGAIGKGSGDGTKGAIIGSVIGGTAGAIIGDYMDKQADELEEEVPGAEVEKVKTVNEAGDSVTAGILVTFDSGILFEFGEYTLTEASRIELQRMAKVFEKYPETDIMVDGHTDNVGSDRFNQKLSEQRAASVADYLADIGIDRTRMVTVGHGEDRPVATNETDEGRQANRRVEVAISANEDLQEKAEAGTLSVPE